MKSKSTSANPWLQENRKYLWIILLVAFSIFAFTTILAIAFQEEPFSYDTSNILFFISLFVIPLIAVNVIFLFKWLFNQYCHNQLQLLWLKIGGLLIGVFIGTVLFEFIYHLNGIVDDDFIVLGDYTFSASASEVIDNLLIALLLGTPMFIKQKVKLTAAKALEEKKQELDKVHQLKTQSELEALQAKVNPHFLYNSLNSIASLIHINPDQAEQMVLSLSELFRYTLNYSSGNFSTVAQESKMVETYLSIEMIRFQENLQCDVSIEEGLDHVMIPRFLLQPLVENAIKHGTSKIQKGIIRLAIKRINDDLVFNVADNGPSFPTEFSSGYGLKSVTDQLELLYSNKHSFELINEPEKMVKIVLEKVFTHD